MLSIVNLEKVGLLRTKNTKNNYKYLKDSMELISTDQDQEASFAYSGYCPLTTRIIESAFKKNHWNGIKK